MSNEDPVLRLGRVIQRRTLLRRAGATAVGLTLGMLGQSKQVTGNCGVSCQPGYYTPYCCCTCFQPSPSCQLSCPGCSWCWSCFSTCDSQYYQCCECHSSNDGCQSSSCTNVICTWVHHIGSRPMAAPARN